MADSHDDKANEIDIESPAEPATEPDVTSPSQKISAEPPRWRFVGDAKKSQGYSTLAAGQYVQGKSSAELGAKYTAPDVSLYKEKGGKPEVGKLQQQSPAIDGHSKEDVEVGKLGLDSASSSPENEVGNIEGKTEEGDGLPELEKQSSQPEEGSDNLPDSPEKKHDTENKLLDDESPNCIESNNEESSPSNSGPEEEPAEVIPKPNQESGGDQLDKTNQTEGIPKAEDVDSSSMSDSKKEENPKKRSRVLYLLLVLLLIMGIVMGVLLGTKNNAGEASAASANLAAAQGATGPVTVINSTIRPSSYPSNALSNAPSATPSIAPSAKSNVPSATPSLAPSAKCKVETKEFSIAHHYRSANITKEFNGSPFHVTWILKNACSGRVIAQCQPWSLGSLSLSRGNPKNNLTRRTEQQLLTNFTECLPDSIEYVFEMRPAKVWESCSGFDPNSFIVSYDNFVLANGVADYNNVTNTYFGESEAPCKSELPSSSPTMSTSAKPSLVPSSIPSTAPTVSPTRASSSPSASPSGSPTNSPTTTPTYQPTVIPSAEPITLRPTASPLAFLGECPDTYEPGSTYTIGVRAESNSTVYQCITVSCRSYGLEPGRNWEVIGSCLNPTTSPNKQPSDSPTAGPSKASISPTTSPSASPFRLPTIRPSGAPVAPPSVSPSKKPSRTPTKQPSESPSEQPSNYLSKQPTTKPSRGPTDNPTGSPSKSPSLLPTKEPSTSPSAQPSKSPTEQPTTKPSKAPTKLPTNAPSRKPLQQRTQRPTNLPTSKPTCSLDQVPFNVCLAVGMSGSICNGPTGALCVGCPSDTICRDSGVAWGSCCSNFAKVKELTTVIVNSLGDLPAEKSFSVVQFASDSRLVSGLSSTAQTLSTVGQLVYSGGFGDHSSAINTCRQSLSSSIFSANRKNFIVLITDGMTGLPENVPEDAADLAAESAKNEGTFIIPVVIPPDAPDISQGIPFLIGISSGGEIFDVRDYDVSKIQQLQEGLTEQVSCS